MVRTFLFEFCSHNWQVLPNSIHQFEVNPISTPYSNIVILNPQKFMDSALFQRLYLYIDACKLIETNLLTFFTSVIEVVLAMDGIGSVQEQQTLCLYVLKINSNLYILRLYITSISLVSIRYSNIPATVSTLMSYISFPSLMTTLKFNSIYHANIAIFLSPVCNVLKSVLDDFDCLICFKFTLIRCLLICTSFG